MDAKTDRKPLDLSQFDGHTPPGEDGLWRWEEKKQTKRLDDYGRIVGGKNWAPVCDFGETIFEETQSGTPPTGPDLALILAAPALLAEVKAARELMTDCMVMLSHYRKEENDTAMQIMGNGVLARLRALLPAEKEEET